MAAFKKHGIVCMFDGVYNHKDGAEETETFKAQMVDQEDRNKWVVGNATSARAS